MSEPGHGGSPSIAQPDYWWFQARTRLLETVMTPYIGSPARVLDVGSADGPSVGWMRHHDGLHVTLDIDPRGLGVNGVCGSALELPFADGSFDVIGAFDVIEHLPDETTAVRELERVLTPGGRLLISVPAYQWAWTDFDVHNGHFRRYTRKRIVRALERGGLSVERATYAYSSVFPIFAAQRSLTRLGEAVRRTKAEAQDIVSVPPVSDRVSQALLKLCRNDERILARRDLPFGSSVFVAARKAD